MATLCAWASIDERGKASGGKAGDQTGTETRTGNWYDFGQTTVYRWKDRDKAKKFASVIKAIVNNPADGYDQGQRTTLNAELKKVGWDPAKLKIKCECDCSSLVVAGVNCVAKKEILSPKLYTGNLGPGLMGTGWFEKLTGSKYCDSGDYLEIGDISNAPGKHVIIALENGSKAVEKKQEKKPAAKPAKPAAKKPAAKKSAPSYKVGKIYKIVADALNVRYTAAGKKKPKKALTADGQKHATPSGALKKGTAVTCKATKKLGNNIWMQVPSGWIAAYHNGHTYVK